MDRDTHIKENYKAFLKISFEDRYAGKFAILKDKKLIEIADSMGDAHKIAKAKFSPDDVYSIQQIKEIPLNLGYMSYALPQNHL